MVVLLVSSFHRLLRQSSWRTSSILYMVVLAYQYVSSPIFVESFHTIQIPSSFVPLTRRRTHCNAQYHQQPYFMTAANMDDESYADSKQQQEQQQEQHTLESPQAHNTETPSTSQQLLLLERHDDPLPPRSSSSSTDQHVVRCVLLSDTHGRHHQLPNPLPEGDVLVHLGDIANRGSLQDIQSFAAYLHTQQAEKFQDIVVIEGNHDRDREDPHRINLKHELEGQLDVAATSTKISVLQDEIVTVANGKLRILGTSWDTCEQNDMTGIHTLATTTTTSSSQDKPSLSSPSKRITNIDMLLTHINPYVRGRGHGWNGSRQIADLVQQLQIPLHCFGHVHYGRGVCDLESDFGTYSAHRSSSSACDIDGSNTSSVMVNCATAWNQPVVIDYCTIQKQVIMVHCPLRKPNIFTPMEQLILSNMS